MVKVIRMISIAVISVAMLVSGAVFAAPAQSANFNQGQKKQIEKIVHEYLIKNPEILVEVSQALQAKEQQHVMKKAQDAIPGYAKELFKDPNSPVAGNAKGNVTLVEFYDYQCIHCKNMTPVIASLMKEDKNLHVIFKEFPIFGANSEYAARAALASVKQGKFLAFHNALMKAVPPLTHAKVMQVAKKVGLNVKTLETAMKNPVYAAEIKQNYKLAQALGILGTPAFVIASNPYNPDVKPYFVPGEVSQSTMQNIIKEVSQKK